MKPTEGHQYSCLELKIISVYCGAGNTCGGPVAQKIEY